MTAKSIPLDPFLIFLETEFNKRKALNPRYSFRAFAHSLKIDSATLHHLMKARRKAGPKRQRHLLVAMGYSTEEIEAILTQFSDVTPVTSHRRGPLDD